MDGTDLATRNYSAFSDPIMTRVEIMEQQNKKIID